MRPGIRTTLPEGRIDYKELRKINPEAARKAIPEYSKTNGANISRTARLFGINRSVIYDIVRKHEERHPNDRSKAPKHQPKKRSALIEDKVIKIKNKTRPGPERLARYLKRHEDLTVAQGAIRHIMRRNKTRINYHLPRNQVRKEKRESIDWYSAKPFEIVQMDIKHIRDHKALTKEQIIHLDRYDVPNYQWGHWM